MPDFFTIFPPPNTLETRLFHLTMKKTILTTLAAALVAGCSLDTSSAQPAVPDLSPYILTPKPADTPRINGARIFGLRPGSECLYTIAATGVRPMTFAAEGLPKGLKLDPETGRITGRVKKTGEYAVRLTATNRLGSCERTLRIVVGDRIALTPPMGWNSWNCWGQGVSQERVLTSARAMVEKGLADHGWCYINIDDGWQSRRGENGAIQPNDKFPDMAALSKEIHDMGLKLGIYSSPWVGTYAGHIGSYADNPEGTYDWIEQGKYDEHFCISDPDGKFTAASIYRHGSHSFVEADVRQWDQWGIDYLKYDWNPNDYYHVREMHDALQRLDRDVVFSLSNAAPYADAPLWMEFSNCWRTTYDIRDTWENMSRIGFSQDPWIAFNRPGSWADPDMLVVGMLGGAWGDLHYTKLTADEQYTHISLWALLAAPLLIGCDMTALDDFTVSLLTNDEVIDVNQDPLGLQAYPVWREGDEVIYVKHLEDGSLAVGFFNRGSSETKMTVSLDLLGLRGRQVVRDLWRQQDITDTTDHFDTAVAPHGVVLVRFYPGNSRLREP